MVVNLKSSDIVPKEITIPFSHFLVIGTAHLSLWGGETGSIEMSPTTIESNGHKVPPEDVIATAINDNGFGCESIIEAQVDVYAVYGKKLIIVRELFFVNEGEKWVAQ